VKRLRRIRLSLPELTIRPEPECKDSTAVVCDDWCFREFCVFSGISNAIMRREVFQPLNRTFIQRLSFPQHVFRQSACSLWLLLVTLLANQERNDCSFNRFIGVGVEVEIDTYSFLDLGACSECHDDLRAGNRNAMRQWVSFPRRERVLEHPAEVRNSAHDRRPSNNFRAGHK